MVTTRLRRDIPLPKDWPQRVRAAVIHAISLAGFSPTLTHGRAARTLDARMRLHSENERLRQDLKLLQEESRSKDARIARFPP